MPLPPLAVGAQAHVARRAELAAPDVDRGGDASGVEVVHLRTRPLRHAKDGIGDLVAAGFVAAGQHAHRREHAAGQIGDVGVVDQAQLHHVVLDLRDRLEVFAQLGFGEALGGVVRPAAAVPAPDLRAATALPPTRLHEEIRFGQDRLGAARGAEPPAARAQLRGDGNAAVPAARRKASLVEEPAARTRALQQPIQAALHLVSPQVLAGLGTPRVIKELEHVVPGRRNRVAGSEPQLLPRLAGDALAGPPPDRGPVERAEPQRGPEDNGQPQQIGRQHAQSPEEAALAPQRPGVGLMHDRRVGVVTGCEAPQQRERRAVEDPQPVRRAVLVNQLEQQLHRRVRVDTGAGQGGVKLRHIEAKHVPQTHPATRLAARRRVGARAFAGHSNSLH